MTVAIVFEIFYPTVTGVLTSAANLAENLMDQGHKVIFLAPETPDFEEPLINGRIPVRYVPSWYNWAYPGMRNVLPWNRSVASILRQEHVDVVHITGPWLLTWATMRAAARSGLPVVHTFHTMLHEPSYVLYFVRVHALIPIFQRIAWWYYGLYVRRSHVNTGPSQMVCNQLIEHFPEADVRFISNGIDVDRFADHASKQSLQEREPRFEGPVFIYVGRLGQEKSIEEVLEAMVLVRERVHDAQLFVVGDGPSSVPLLRYAKELHLHDCVHFLGKIPNAELLQSGLVHHATAFVTASTTENQPMTVIEAICCNTPVIVPDVPGITELVNKNGLRFRPHDTRSLAYAMASLANDEYLHEKAVQASDEMKSRYDGREVARRFADVYQSLVDLRE